MATTSGPRLPSLNIDKVNPNVKAAEYAVRGELAVRAENYRQQLQKSSSRPPTPGSSGGSDSSSSLPFDSVISANIGNPQQLDQQPITFFRQVASLLENPALLEKEQVLRDGLGYEQDVIDRATRLLADVKSVGAYSQSQGAQGIRDSIAQFIERRDGYSADPNTVYLTAGASSGVNTLLNIMLSGPETGVLVPIPQYPLYTATLAVLNAQCVPYYLEEDKNWSTDLSAIKSSISEARKNGTDVRAIVVINPGNPTGGSLAVEDIQNIIDFAVSERLVIMADEVYQTNIFEGEFTSFKKALRQMQANPANGDKYANVELASLHSISKGMVGECGHRGGYMELVGFDEQVVEQIYKFVSISLCPPVIGQCLVEMMVNPPKEGEPSYPLYKKEYDGIFKGLKERAFALYDAFKEMDGVKCQRPLGSMYLYPKIELPEKAIEQAKTEGRSPDAFYVSRMLDKTGICMVPGGGFGQKEGTLHFRTTFLPPGTEWVGRIRDFHQDFMKEFS